jgi:ketosteroid isomerase-like protein
MGEPFSVQQLRKGYEAFASGDMDALSEVIPEDAVWHVGGRAELSGDYKGRDAVFGYFGRLMEVSDGTFKADLVHVVGDDKFAVALQHSTWTANGQSYDGTDVLVDRVDADGRAVETWIYLEDQQKADEIFGAG